MGSVVFNNNRHFYGYHIDAVRRLLNDGCLIDPLVWRDKKGLSFAFKRATRSGNVLYENCCLITIKTGQRRIFKSHRTLTTFLRYRIGISYWQHIDLSEEPIHDAETLLPMEMET